jgi:hypothetical protein
MNPPRYEVSGWSEEAFQARLEARARELGQPLSKLLANIGLGHDTLKRNVGARRLDTLERIAGALGWSLAEVMGFNPRIDIKLSGEAFAAAQRMLARLPKEAQTDDNFVWAHACIYDLLSARLREGRLPDDPALRVEILQTIVETMVASWEGRDPKTRP